VDGVWTIILSDHALECPVERLHRPESMDDEEGIWTCYDDTTDSPEVEPGKLQYPLDEEHLASIGAVITTVEEVKSAHIELCNSGAT